LSKDNWKTLAIVLIVFLGLVIYAKIADSGPDYGPDYGDDYTCSRSASAGC
jgi:hypothetical protein